MQNIFRERLTKTLEESEFPQDKEERLVAFAKMFSIRRHEANTILSGKAPAADLLMKIADEFEVKPNWLLGK
tara:strand:- start:120161 stop:120376 length:216 start_codon:yes stop_codon:yes gene_type:complete